MLEPSPPRAPPLCRRWYGWASKGFCNGVLVCLLRDCRIGHPRRWSTRGLTTTTASSSPRESPIQRRPYCVQRTRAVTRRQMPRLAHGTLQWTLRTGIEVMRTRARRPRMSWKFAQGRTLKRRVAPSPPPLRPDDTCAANVTPRTQSPRNTYRAHPRPRSPARPRDQASHAAAAEAHLPRAAKTKFTIRRGNQLTGLPQRLAPPLAPPLCIGLARARITRAPRAARQLIRSPRCAPRLPA